MPGLDKVEVEIVAVAGVCVLPLAGLLRLGRGARLALTTLADERVEIRAHGVAVGQGRIIRGREDRLALEISALAQRPQANAAT